MRVRQIALGVSVASVASIVIASAAKGWTVTKPSAIQLIIWGAFLAVGFLWFWIWCGLQGVQMGTDARLSGNVKIKNDDHRRRLQRRSQRAHDRLSIFGKGLPLAFAVVLIGFAVLLS